MTETDLSDARLPSERRTSDRKKLIVDVRFEGGDGTGIANTRDIGSGGLYMTTTAPLDVGTPIVMALNIGERSMNILGTVVYSDPGHGVGVRFKDLSADDETFLSEIA
ncbi:MAG TPA: PilZ domain-containing protein [Pyrinomonadaceae bacterium]|nr:PilZ domain-containing protein [Acidobacteriota bacterium]HQZ95687.1 PilZ domain-containing protein [Pyrinomonadaceae bacterium]